MAGSFFYPVGLNSGTLVCQIKAVGMSTQSPFFIFHERVNVSISVQLYKVNFWIMLLWCVVSPVGAEIANKHAESEFVSSVTQLTARSFKLKATAVDNLVSSSDSRVMKILENLLAGTLYYRKQDKAVLYVEEVEEGFQSYSVWDDSDLGILGSREVKKIRVNNALRSKLRGEIARLNLQHTNPKVRLQAAKTLQGKLNSEQSALPLREALKKEQDKSVSQALKETLAIFDLDKGITPIQLDAVDVLKNSLSQEARVKLNALANETDNKELSRAAEAAVAKIDSRFKFYSFVETLFFGLSLGSVLLLIAVGLAITFGVMGVINMAHGELMMLGAYTTYVVQLMMPNAVEYSLFLAIPLAFLVSGAVGIAIERGVIRFLYGRPLETLLATFGISLILQQLVRSIFSSLNRPVTTPDWMSGFLQINDALSLTFNRLYILIFSLILFVGLLLVLKKTSLGLQVRAVSQNREMAKAMGIRTEWVDALTFGLGSGIAGVAGVALSQLTNVGPNLGQSYIIDSFMVVVFGGVGNLWGTLVGAMSLGVLNKFIEPFSGAVLAKIVVLVFIILFIQRRPRGLFPQQGRAAEN